MKDEKIMFSLLENGAVIFKQMEQNLVEFEGQSLPCLIDEESNQKPLHKIPLP